MTVLGYVRVSTTQQNTENQRLAILEYANKSHLTVDSWITVSGSSRKSAKDRRIEELLDQVQTGNILVVAELSRLGRSVGQIAMLGLYAQRVQKFHSGVRLVGKLRPGTYSCGSDQSIHHLSSWDENLYS